MLSHLKEIISACERAKIIWSLSPGFSLQGERVFHLNFVFLCVIVILDCLYL